MGINLVDYGNTKTPSMNQMPSAVCYTDHRLVRRKVTFAFKSPLKRKGPQMKKLQVHKLRDLRVKNNLQVMLEERLHCVTAAKPEEQWKQMKIILQETMAEVVGLSQLTIKKKEVRSWLKNNGLLLLLLTNLKIFSS